MNRWNIPQPLEQTVIDRDRSCIFCGIAFVNSAQRRGDRATWEHIVNDARIVTADNIARCCASCNASKGAKTLDRWLLSRYCERRGISERSMAPVAQAALRLMALAAMPSPPD